MKLGTKIKSLRQAKSWSLSETAARLKTSVSTYRDWEDGRKIPAEMLVAIAALHGSSVSALLGQKQRANEELALGIMALEKALEHIRSALSKL